MIQALEAEAALTTQNQVTIPALIRKALKLTGGKSRVKLQLLPGEGKVIVARVEPATNEPEDPALEPFLNLLADDMEKHPAYIAPFSRKLFERARSLVDGIEVDLDGPLTGED